MNVYEIVMTILAIVFGGLSLYISARKNILDAVEGYINDAEDTFKDATKAGGSKFEWVVDRIVSIIPVALKPFISRALVEATVQKVFDIMESYAAKQADKLVNKVFPVDKVSGTVTVGKTDLQFKDGLMTSSPEAK